MSLFYVTGLSGTGKSAVLTELHARGYRARGVDEDRYADWINRDTGRPDSFPHGDPGLDLHAWYQAHDWTLSMRRIGVLSRAAARLGTPVFLCGTAAGDRTVWHLFEKVLALIADVPTLEQRIAARASEFGKAPEELAAILRWHASYEAAYRRFGAVVIDAARPLAEVVDEILTSSIQRSLDQDEKSSVASSRDGTSGVSESHLTGPGMLIRRAKPPGGLHVCRRNLPRSGRWCEMSPLVPPPTSPGRGGDGATRVTDAGGT